MIIIENFVKREATTEELAAMQAEATKAALMERSRPLTEAEVQRMLLSQQVNTITVDDNTALRMREFYPAFDDISGQTVKQGFKFRYGTDLWKVAQPELTIQSHYAPGPGMESLYTVINETHDGTKDDPIPYSGNMELTEGLYYHQDYVIYLCTRSTGQAVHHALSELVGLYVEVAA